MKGLNWGLCSSSSWTDNDNRHALIAEESSHFGISCQTANFDDRYKNNTFFKWRIFILLERNRLGPIKRLIVIKTENHLKLSWIFDHFICVPNSSSDGDFECFGTILNIFLAYKKVFFVNGCEQTSDKR